MLRRAVIGTVFLLLAGLQSVHAEVARGIVFMSAGQTTVEHDEFSGTATALKIGGGFQATDTSSIEIYWVSYGEATDDDVGAEFRVEAFSMILQYAYHYPLGANFGLLGKVGFALWKTNYGSVGLEKEQDDGIDPVIAIGAQMDISDNWAVRIEWEYAEFDNTDVSLVSAGVLTYFD